MSDNEIINIDSRSHLEVADSCHRYSKNLRYYFKEYNRMFGCSNIIDAAGDGSSSSSQKPHWSRYDPFFRWLDETVPQPNLSCCPRYLLDSDTVTYLNTDADRSLYEIEISREGLLKSKVDKQLISTGSKGWIFVLRHSRMFACEKRTVSPRLQHSSFFGGDVVNAAGMFVCDDGELTTLFPHSGHYRPLNSHLCSLLQFFHQKGINLRNVQVDVQRVFKTTRQKDPEGGKVRKTDTPYFKDGEYVFNFLRTKQNVVHSGFLFQIEAPPLLKKTAVSPRDTGSTCSNTEEDSSKSDIAVDDGCSSVASTPLGIRIPLDADCNSLQSSTTAYSATSTTNASGGRVIGSHSIPIYSNTGSSGSNASNLAIDKPWLSASYDPPSESSSPVVYGGYLNQSFMDSFQRSNSGGFVIGDGSTNGNNASVAVNAAMVRAKVLGKHLMNSNPSSATNSSSAKDVALLLAESPSMLLLSASNGSSRAHTPGGYNRSRIRTLSETSKRAQESQDDLVSLGIVKSGSRDVMTEGHGGNCSSSGGGVGSDSEDVLNMLDIHASLLVN